MQRLHLSNAVRLFSVRHRPFQRSLHLAMAHTTASEPDSETYGKQRYTKGGRRDVVTAFVRNQNETTTDLSTFLVVKRSEQVNTYKLHWGGVSGVVEEGDVSLQERAATEIFEEVGYSTPDQVTFVRSGRPLYVDDPHTGALKFAVHPFLFDLTPRGPTPPPPPRLQWENVDLQFVAAGALETMQTVPRLVDTLARLTLTPRQEAVLKTLTDDRTHGAAQLAYFVLDALEEDVRWYRSENGDEDERINSSSLSGPMVLESLRNYGYHLACCRPSMTSLATTVAIVLSQLHHRLHDVASAFEVTQEEVCNTALEAVAKVRHQLTENHAALVRHVAQDILKDGCTVMTISKSSSVIQALEQAVGEEKKKINVVVCESRPLYEGVAVAQKLSGIRGIGEVTVITDAQAGVFLRQKGTRAPTGGGSSNCSIDCVVVGADAVDDKGVHNKSGTYMVALAAREAGVPVYALADTTSKISPGMSVRQLAEGAQEEEEEEENSADEVSEGWGTRYPGAKGMVESGVRVRNVYFESTPLDLVTAVVTEDGPKDKEFIENAVCEMKERYVEAFQLEL